MPARSVIGPPAGLERLEDPVEAVGVVGHPFLDDQRLGVAGPVGQLRPGLPDPLDQPRGQHLLGVHLEQLVLDGRRPGVDDEDPTHRRTYLGRPLGLDGGDGHGVDDVGDQGAPGQVVDRLAQALEDRPDGDRVGRALHRLVGVVAGVEVGEHEHGGPAGDLAVGQLGAGDRWVDGRVVLDRPLDQEVGPALPGDRGGLADLLDVAARARLAGRVGEQGDPRLDAELGGRARRGDRDVGQLLGVGVGDHRAVAVDQHPVGQQHQEHAGHDRGAGHGADELERRPDGVGGGVGRPRHHPVGQVLVDHHGAEVGDVGDQVLGHRPGHALVAAQLVVGVGEVLAPLRPQRVDHLEAVQLQAEGGAPVLDGVGVAEHGEVGDAAQQHLLGRLQHPVVAALGEDDVAAVGLGPLDQPLLEHQRGDPLGPGDLQAAQQPLAVDVGAEHPEGGGDLALALGGEHPPDPGDGGRRPVGVGPGGQHRHLRAAEPVDQPQHRRLGDQPAGQDQPGDVRVGAGEPGGQAAHDQVGPVAGGDDHVVVADVLQEVGQAHGADDHVADLAAGARLLGPADRPQELGGQGVGDLGHGGGGQLRDLGHDVGRLARPPPRGPAGAARRPARG